MADKKLSLDICTACNKNKSGRVNVMDCCYSTCKDWLGDGKNIDGSDCHNLCKGCLSDFIKQADKTECTYYTGIPAVYNQVPSFYPELYSKTKNKEISLERCKNMCNNTNFPNTCIEKCNILNDSLIVENTSTNFISDTKQTQKNNKVTNTNLNIFLLRFLLGTLIILIILRAVYSTI